MKQGYAGQAGLLAAIALPGGAQILRENRGQEIEPRADTQAAPFAGAGIPSDLAAPALIRQMLDAIPLAMIIIDRRGTIRAFGKGAQDLFGYSAADMIGRNVAVLTPPHVAAQHDSYLEHHARTGERRVIGSSRIEMARHRAGHNFPVELKVSELQLGDEVGYIGFLRPIAGGELQQREAKTMLAELAQASRVSAMGALATAIAHELNQPLTNIANWTQGLSNLVRQQDAFKSRTEVLKILDKCSSQAVRAGQLLHRLRDFVKGGQPRTEITSVAELVRDAAALAMINGFKRTIHINNEIPADLPLVAVDRLQAQQVLFNLLRNAFEAVDAEHGGRHEILISARDAGHGFVEISVEDEGPGIAPEIANSLFESFVTTKGGGMGVGLAICKQIVESCGGRITAEPSQRLAGAAFRFTVPVAAAPTGMEG